MVYRKKIIYPSCGNISWCLSCDNLIKNASYFVRINIITGTIFLFHSSTGEFEWNLENYEKREKNIRIVRKERNVFLIT